MNWNTVQVTAIEIHYIYIIIKLVILEKEEEMKIFRGS